MPTRRTDASMASRTPFLINFPAVHMACMVMGATRVASRAGRSPLPISTAARVLESLECTATPMASVTPALQTSVRAMTL